MLKPTTHRFAFAASCAFLCGALACSARIESEGLRPEPVSNPAPSRDPQADARPADPGPPGSPGFGGDSPDGGAADATPTVENSPVAFEPHCGLPPFQSVRFGAHDIMAPRSDLSGVQVTLKHCPGQSFTVPDGGLALWITAGAETWIRFDAPGYIPWVEGELRIPDAFPAPYIEATMLPLGVADIVMPKWKPDAPIIYVEVRTGRSSADEACQSPADVALSVKGYPDALVLYRNKGANADYGDGRGTSAEGVAVVTNLPVGVASVELQASKVGCNYQPAFGDANSPELLPIVRAPLFAGAITHQVINPAR